jgi:S-methylmethionine-dependent homocysteine/selenocysteine methylase
MPNPNFAKYRARLPQLEESLFLTDGGLETTLIFHEGWNLPMFESFVLMESEKGRGALVAYYERYIAIAKERGRGFVLESPTWRANPDWAAKIGYDRARLADVNRAALNLMLSLRDIHETSETPIVVSGNVGPRGDGYDPRKIMSADEAQDYHAWQIGLFRDAGADLVSAFTITNINEGIGFARAAEAAGMPCVISFTLETDGRLPTGEMLPDAIAAVDSATRVCPAYFMINCAHPTHFDGTLEKGAAWMQRLRGVRANSSCLSHAELDNSPELDPGNPVELGQQYGELLKRYPHITVVGGCCGTDHRHIECISQATGKAA